MTMSNEKSRETFEALCDSLSVNPLSEAGASGWIFWQSHHAAVTKNSGTTHECAMTSNEKSREEFEAWHDKQVSRLLEHGEPTAARVWKDFKGMHWNAWQASREALVIELPKAWQTNVGAMLTPNGVRFAIEDAGLKVKP